MVMRNAMKTSKPLLMLTAYYSFLVAALLFIIWLYPEFSRFLPVGGTGSLASGMDEFMTGKPALMDAEPIAQMVTLAISLVAVLFLMEPVAWIYMGARRRKGREQSFILTILLLPVVVAGIVLIVQNSLALAFSLAGIVAAVRFRLTLDDTLDAIYVFVAIGAGLAAGIQAIEIAVVVTVIFNYLILLFWSVDYGDEMSANRWFSREWMMPKVESIAEENQGPSIDD